VAENKARKMQRRTISRLLLLVSAYDDVHLWTDGSGDNNSNSGSKETDNTFDPRIDLPTGTVLSLCMKGCQLAPEYGRY